MIEKLKPYLIAVLVALAALIAATLAYMSGTPTPTPSSTPTQTPSSTASPSPSSTPSPTSSPLPSPTAAALRLMVGMTDGFDLTATAAGPASFDAGPVHVEALEVRDVETKIPSFKGARVGLYPDALMPTTSLAPGKRYWVDVTGRAAGQGVVFGKSVEVVATAFAWPLPVYMEMQFAQIARAHGLADEGATYAQRLVLAKQYAALLRSHGVEPIKHAVTVYPDATFKNLNWNELVLDGRIAPPCLFGPAPSLPPSVALLQAIEAALKSGALPKGSFSYSWDEGEGDPSATAQALARVNLIRSNAPSLRQMITRRPDASFGAITFTPVMNLFAGWGSGTPGWLYVSCMSNGNCQNQSDATRVAPATSFPMMVLDAPETEPERFVREAAALGATGLLYFNTTQRMPTAFDPGGQYNEGGNGDGTLLYPQGGVSRRLKFLRRGLNALAWQKAVP